MSLTVDSVYWWKDEAKAIANRFTGRDQSWVGYAANPVSEAWIRNMSAYYSCLIAPSDWQSSLGFAGEQGELVQMVIPQARSIVRQVVGLATKERLVFKGVAQTQGSDVMNEIKLANAVAEEIIMEQELDRKNEFAVEQACVMGAGFFYPTWRTDKGAPYAVDGNGMMVYDGAIDIATPLIQDVFYDTRLSDWSLNNWVKVRTVKNRWDLISQFPDLEQEIRSIPKITEDVSLRSTQQMIPSDEDMIYVDEAYHKPSPALPQGRMLMFSSPECIYFDGPNFYGCIPVIPVMPEMIQGTGYAYPMLSSLLPAQEMFDHSVSAIATNQSNLAIQNVLCPRSANIGVQELKGMNLVLYTPQNAAGGGKPEPLNLLQSAPETFKFADVVSKYMLSVSPLNSTVRGEPPAGVTSGTAIATLTANSLEFLSGLARADQKALESLMTLCVNIQSKFAQTPRSVMIQGKNNQTFSREYTGENLKNIKKFKLERQNPLMNTLSGRINAAESLIKMGAIKSTQEYLSVLDGAPLTRMTDTETSENDLIESENENMMSGQPAPVLITDNHPLHVFKHKTLLNDPNVRMNSDIVQGVLAHIQEHEELAKTGDPVLMGMANTGQMPQIPPEQQGPPPGAGGPPGQIAPASPNGLGEGTNEPANPATDLLQGGR